MLRALIWKDVRVNRVPLTLAAALVVASYGAIAILAMADPSVSAQPAGRVLSVILMAGSIACHVSAQLSLAVLAGNSIAAERADRSAEFLAYLPPGRGAILASKAILLACVALALLLIHAAGIGLAIGIGGMPPDAQSGFDLSLTATIFAVGFCGAGIGWLASCSLSNNAAAILCAILAPIIVAVVVLLAALAINRPESMASNLTPLLAAAWLAVGAAGFVWGTRRYLRRVEP